MLLLPVAWSRPAPLPIATLYCPWCFFEGSVPEGGVGGTRVDQERVGSEGGVGIGDGIGAERSVPEGGVSNPRLERRASCPKAESRDPSSSRRGGHPDGGVVWPVVLKASARIRPQYSVPRGIGAEGAFPDGGVSNRRVGAERVGPNAELQKPVVLSRSAVPRRRSWRCPRCSKQAPRTRRRSWSLLWCSSSGRQHRGRSCGILWCWCGERHTRRRSCECPWCWREGRSPDGGV